MFKKFDVAAKVGFFKGSDGKTKNKYQNVGVVFEGDDGRMFMVLEPWFNPAGIEHQPGKGIMLSLFEPKREPPKNYLGEAYGTKLEEEFPF